MTTESAAESIDRYESLIGPIFTYYAAMLDGCIAGLQVRNYNPVFVARGGHTLKRILAKRHKALSITSPTYPTIQISRVLSTIAAFSVDKDFALGCLISEIGHEPAQPIVRSLLINPLALNGIDTTGLAESIPSDETFANYIKSESLSSKNLIDHIVSISKVHKKFISDRLGNDPVALIDTGWAGSIQYLLSKISDNDIFGLYIGRYLPMKSAEVQVNSLGILFDDELDSATGGSVPTGIGAIAHYRHLIEDLLEPECQSAEYVFPQGRKISTNQIASELTKFGGQRKNRINSILNYVENHSADSFASIERSFVEASEMLARAIMQPTEDDIELLGNVTRKADFGKMRYVPVILPPEDRFEGDSPAQRIEASLWPTGQRAVEGLSNVPAPAAQVATVDTLVTPSVQVIMRTKDRPAFLQRALRSVGSQTYKNYHLTIVNDGGAPEPVNLAAAAFPYRDRLTVIHNEKSLGMEAASNLGIRSGNSDFIVIHDDDDSWNKNFLSDCIEFLIDRGTSISGVVTSSISVFEEISNGKVVVKSTERYMPWVERIDITDLSTQNLFPPIAFVFSREAYQAIGGYDESFKVLGDWDFNLRFAANYSVAFLPKPLANYHQRPTVKTGAAANSLYGTRDLHSEFLGHLRQKYLRASANDPVSAGIFQALCIGQTRSELATTRLQLEKIQRSVGGSSGDNDTIKDAAFLWVENQFMKSVIKDLASQRKLAEADVAILSMLLRGLTSQAVESIMARPEGIAIPSFFNDSKYLNNHPDVANVVKSGTIKSGFEHYVRWGINEGRDFK